MNAKQAFKKAYGVARKMRQQAFGQAEFSAEHQQWFTSYKFTHDVNCAVGINPSLSKFWERFATDSAAHIVAVGASSSSAKTVQKCLADKRDADNFAYDYV